MAIDLSLYTEYSDGSVHGSDPSASNNPVVLVNEQFTDGVLPPASTVNTSVAWSSGAKNSSTIAIVDDPDFPSGKAVEGIYPAQTQGIDVWHSLDVSALLISEIFIEFKAKMIGTPGSCKFMKVFGLPDFNGNANGDYANCTLQPQVNTGGRIAQMGYGDGSVLTNDFANVINFDGSSPESAGRSYPATADPYAPQGASFSDWTGVNTFRVHVKFNSGTTAGDEVADGKFYVEINNTVYIAATGLFNRHYENGPISKIGFFDWTQGNNEQLQLRFSDIKISTGGFIT